MNQFLAALIFSYLSHWVSSVASSMQQQQQPALSPSASLPFTSEANAGLPWLQHQLQALRDDCHQAVPLGLISGQIRDWQVTASSTYPQEWDRGCHDRYARLYQPNGLGWCAKYKSASEWLQVDLGVITKVTGVMTQGRNDGSEWVTSFMLSHSFDGRHWSYVIDQYGNQKVFEGNTDSYSAKYSYLDEPIFARFVRFHTVQWNRHPSMRVELIGCQVCNVLLSLPPSAKVSASNEKWQAEGSSCQAENAYIFTNKAWCSKTDNNNQWLQFDIGPPTLVTGVVTRGRGDEGRNHWVKRFRLSYSNDSNVWYFYKDNSHLDAKRTWDVSSGRSSVNSSSSSSSASSHQHFIPNRQSLEGLEFGANSNKHEERYHFLNSPFTARYVRFHPVDWHRHISMRAGIIGCPYKGDCVNGFMRINEESPCVENLAYHKDSFVNKRHLKRHIRNQWIRGQAGLAVDGRSDQDISNCTILDNYQVDKPTWMVDLGRKVKVAGVKIQTWTGNETDNLEMSTSSRDYMHNLEKLVVYVDNKGGKDKIDHPGNMCGGVSRQNDALYRPKLHVPCKRPIRGRYVYIEAWGMADRPSKLFSAVLCEVWVYE